MTLFNSLRSIVTLSFAVGAFAAIGPVTDLTISDVDIAPDNYTRAAVLAGGTFPGPLITGNKGDNFQINVINDLSDSTMLKTTSIHWHGFFQNGTNWADGPAFVNQCPIASGNSFLYNFEVPNQAGTFWYHSHLATQYCDGLRGPFVVYDPDDPYLNDYDVDDESTVITIADWYHTQATLASKFPTADATLINGLGRSSDSSNLTVITVESGKRYRFRLISISCDPNYVFAIDSHTLNVIEADSVSTEPLTVDSIQIYAGQRYSFILTANQTVGNYWIRANPNVGSTGFSGGINSAILRYSGADEVEPATTADPTYTNPLSEVNLHTLVNPGAPGTAEIGGVDIALLFDVTFNGTDTNFYINGETYVSPTVPVLLQILSGAQLATDLLPSGSVYVLPANKTVEITIPGGAVGGGHPIHLHGHTFDVVRSSGSDVYNYVNPVRRDVVNIGTTTSDNTTFRFSTNNPGPWFLHCHIDWHLEAGFAIIFAEDTADTSTANTVPDAWTELCPIYDALDDSDH